MVRKKSQPWQEGKTMHPLRVSGILIHAKKTSETAEEMRTERYQSQDHAPPGTPICELR